MRILAVTGASGGHIFPALAFLDNLKDKAGNIDILLVLPKKGIGEKIAKFGFPVKYISISSIKFSFTFKNFVAIFDFFKGALESLFILADFKPDAVVGFGSLTCIPLVMLAWIFRIKTVIHEQNAVPGEANRFLAKFADKIAVSFLETKGYFGGTRRVIFTGNPLRKELCHIEKNRALDFFGLHSGKFTILVMGGSQGSEKINREVTKVAALLTNKARLQIIHLGVGKDYLLATKGYRDLGIEAKCFSFLNEMHYAYSASDLIVSRAGATAIAEIIFFKLPAIIIPYPYAQRHQLNNAKVLERSGAAVVIEDNALNAAGLKELIEALLDAPQRLEAMRLSYANLSGGKVEALLSDAVLSF